MALFLMVGNERAWEAAETVWAQELNGVSTVKTVIKNFFIVVMCM